MCDFDAYWTDINQQLFVPPSNVKISGLGEIMYRGLPDNRYELTTALQRLNVTVQRHAGRRPIITGADLRDELQYRERRLIDSFRKYARSLLPFGITDWEVMVLGQHYRLPTRLLDWTASPLVALFFATEPVVQGPEKQEPNGVIWCVSHAATLSLCDTSLLDRLRATHKRTADTDFMNTIASIEDFDALTCSDPSLLWFEPYSVDQRIVNQFAVFSLMQGVTTRVDHWLTQHEGVSWRVHIGADMKAFLRRRLYLLNVTDRTLFPGLEGIARWQRAYYSD